MKITVTEIARDGQVRRRTVDTTGRDDASRWEELAERAAIGDPPVYSPTPGRPVFAIEVDDQEAMVAERDVTGPLGQLVTAVLIEGDAE